MNVNSPKVSIIVPVYNVEKYLHRCVDSILLQTFTDFELLLIDDGSTDKSVDICDKYALKDSRIRVFHKKNGGVSSARNLGIKKSNGVYILFVDSDDYLAKPTGDPDERNGLLSKEDKATIDSFVSKEVNYGTFTGTNFDDDPINTNYAVTGSITSAKKVPVPVAGSRICTL